MLNNELVTIAIPTYNRSNYVKQSITSALSQTYTNIEVIVSDNCSEDTTPDTISSFSDKRLRSYRQEKNLGMVGNWNFCLNQAKGFYFILLSDDDLLEPTAIEKMVSGYCSKQHVAFVWANFIYIDSYGNQIRKSYKAPLHETGESFIQNSLSRKRDTIPSAILHRTGDAKRLGGYRELGTASDLIFRLYLALEGDVICINQRLVYYRQHTEALSMNTEAVLASFNAIIEGLNGDLLLLRPYNTFFNFFIIRYLYSMALQNKIVASNYRTAFNTVIDNMQLSLLDNFKAKLILLLVSLKPVVKLAKFRRYILEN